MLKKNDFVTVSISDMSSEGSGIGKADGFPLFVPLTAVGDVVSVKVVSLKKSYGFGIVDKIIDPSDCRKRSDCGSFSKCGGCVYRHITYKEELRIKTKKVKDAFYKIGNMDIDIPSCIGSKPRGYRNKAQIPVGKNETGSYYGFYAANSHRIIPFDFCTIQNFAFNDIAKAVKQWIDDFSVSVYDDKSGEGIVRHIYMRIGEKTGEIMVCLIINSDTLPHSDELVEALRKSAHNITGVLININTDITNVVMGNKTDLLWGKPFIYDKFGDLTFKISPESFYQINREQTESLYNKVKEFADFKGDETVLDMYCGTGTISLYLADKSKAVYGVEIIPEAIENAKENAKINSIENATFFAGDSSEGAKWLESINVKPNIIVVDPPRKGCAIKVLEDIVNMNPEKIIYVSCDPATLARDIKILSEKGYKSEQIQPFDMFPRTSHVETVVLITRVK